ncbi:hypothetical protein [uncultured Methanobrevibacter sp.]|uniref:hypothetical protein n=1 Tax=uncultured Methanobrevibacter sp. TaxID=253161 RepID=UPI002609A7FE|nr:hypothetical protein [uncultured Methanobrevibacter sp.]
MTERIVKILYEIKENIQTINQHLSKINAKMNENNEIIQVGDWILRNASMEQSSDENITIAIYCQTPRGHKIYEATLNNVYAQTKDFVSLIDKNTDKVEMINKDCIYKIIIDTKDDVEKTL